MEQVAFQRFGSEAMGLFNDARSAFASSRNAEIKDLARKVPSSFVDEDTPVRIVFAGGYSAGKSSILSILTGMKLKTGGGIVTSEVTKLNWNGITVYDTPGVHTKIHPDHDQLTYDAIAEADLVVFVVTNEGFGDHLGKHFRKLLIEKGKGNEMMLVVNKMEDDEMGNTPRQQRIFIEKNLLPIISPNFNAEDLYTTFIDVYSYLYALQESDPEERRTLMENSGFEKFVANLNRFIKDKQLLGRCTSNLYLLEQQITEAMAKFSSGDRDVDLTRQWLTRNRRVLVEARDRIQDKSYAIVRNNTSVIKSWGNDIANTLTTKDNEKSVNERLERKSKEVNAVPEKIAQEISQLIDVEAHRISQNIDNINSSQLGSMFFEAAHTAIEDSHINPKKANVLGNVASKAAELGKLLSSWTKGPNAVGGLSNIGKLANFSGSDAHKVVLGVGHFLGKKFAPWEAVKWVRNIGVAGKVLGIAGGILGIFLQASSDNADAKMEQQLREGRSEIRSSFDEAADVIDLEFDQRTNQWIENVMDPRIQDIDNKLSEINTLVENQTAEYQALERLLNRTRTLISQIQSA